jgi:hypothetical protein
VTVYMTKVWGFGEPVGPLQFSSHGWRENARDKLKRGDLVVLVGTRQDPTIEGEQGRVLGVMEPTTLPVQALDFLEPRRESDLNTEGQYKWPLGLLNLRAWRIDEPRPLLSDLTNRHFAMDSAQGIVELTPDEAAAVLALPRTESQLLTSSRVADRLERYDDPAKGKGAPPPSAMRRALIQMRRDPAFTYLFELTGAKEPSFKMGWAFDWKHRLKGFNQAAMPDLGGIRYAGRLFEKWPTAMAAFGMEQALLRRFAKARHPRNREVLVGLTLDDLKTEWTSFVGSRAAAGLRAIRQAASR